MKSFLILILLCSALNAQQIYYQEHSKTKTDKDEIKVTFENKDYFIYKGKLSKNGDLIAGFLIDNPLKRHIEMMSKKKIIDFFEPPTLNFVLYNIKKKQIVLKKEYDYFPEYSFLKDNIFYIDENENILVMKLQSTIYKEVSIPIGKKIVRKYSDNLYLFEKELKKVDIYKLNDKTINFNFIFSIEFNLNEIKYIQDNKVFVVEDNDTKIRVYDNNDKIVKVHSFDKIINILATNGLFVAASKNNGYSYYNYDFQKQKFIELFTFKELHNLTNDYSSRILDAIWDNKQLLFIYSTMNDSNQNICSFKPFNNYFIKLSKNGFVTSPFGIIRKNN